MTAELAATVAKWLPLVGRGFLMNLLVSVLAMALGTALGFPLGLGQNAARAPVRRLCRLITQFFRNAPWLVLVFYSVFLLPFELRLAGGLVPVPGWLKATVGLALPVMGNVSEIVRGGIQSVPWGQWESARSLAFSPRRTLWSIILPQCLKRMVPPWMNLYAVLTMATPLMSVAGVEEALTLTRYALSAEGRNELMLPMYGLLLLAFFAWCYPIARWTARLERRFAVKT